jgi:hypothetical protein
MKHTTVGNSLLISDNPRKFQKTAATVESTTTQTLTAVTDFFFLVNISGCINTTIVTIFLHK